MDPFVRIVFCLVLGLGFGVSFAQGTYSSPLFSNQDLIEVRLIGPFSNLLQDRGNDPDYHDCTWSYREPDGRLVTLNVEVKSRGNFRRDEAICDFPPLRLNFKKGELKGTILEGENKLKLVTHCESDQGVLREYYLYRIYNLLTPFSLRARLLRVTYVPFDNEMAAQTRFAFLLEDDEAMAERNGGEIMARDTVLSSHEVDQAHGFLLHLFQFMIANRDFSLADQQNLEIVDLPGQAPVMVGYDFDWSGMVDAGYTRLPYQKGSMYDMRQEFRPFCAPDSLKLATIQQFKGLEEEVLELYSTSPWLENKVKRVSLRNLRQFYKKIGDPEFVQEQLLGECPESSAE